MKQWEDKFKERLEDYEMKLPSMDQQSFWDRKAVRERAAKRRRSFLAVAVGVPAAAAILLTVIMSINLLNTNNPPASSQSNYVAQPPTVVEIESDADIQEDILASTGDYVGENEEWVEIIEDQEEKGAYLVVEEMPEFKGGSSALMEYLRNEVVYPDQAKSDSIQGRVLVSFIVETDGSITNPKVVKSVNPLLDAEALRVVSAMPKWNPGKINDSVCRVRFTIPVNFRIK